MSQLNRVKDARREIQRGALARWIERTVDREINKAEVASGGDGAADSPQRNARFHVRQAGLAKARELWRAGMLPLGLERKMGATLDYTPFAPSESARMAGRPVARIVENIGADLVPTGIATGFLIADGLLMTNYHVFPTASDAFGTGANFLYEQTERGVQAGKVFELDPSTLFVNDEKLDFAIVAVKATALDGSPLRDQGLITLVEATPKILKGQAINIIQHPIGGPKQYAVSQNRLVDILEADGFLHYETDTLEGSSGSPAFSQAWELVALHHASIPEVREGRVRTTTGGIWTEEMGDDQVHWIANEGIRVSAIVGCLSKMILSDRKHQAILSELLNTTTDPVDELAGGTSAFDSGNVESIRGEINLGGNPMAGTVLNFTGPVTIHIHQGSAVSGVPIPASVAPVVVAEKVIRYDPDYKNREGYDPSFLDPENKKIRVPIPGIAAERLDEILTNKNGKPLILKYHHYELVMNESRRMQMWSAVNVDYDPKKKRKARDEFGSDKWIPDPRIPAEAQIFDADFYKPAGNIDRGHIVRREDNAWGDTVKDEEFANSDTFHWTNCTPQHEAFNQSVPGKNDKTYAGMKGLWGDFENYIQQSRKGDDTKVCILAGPVLAPDDPAADFGRGEIQYPLRFWKIACVAEPKDGNAEDLELKVFGFVLSQKDVVKDFGIEVFRPGRFKKYQVSLEKITEITGVTFDEILHNADTLKGT